MHGNNLKIGLNATCFNLRPSGAKQRFIGVYSELIRCLPDDEFVVYEPMDCRVADWFNWAPNMSSRPTPLLSEGRLRKVTSGIRYWPDAFSRDSFDVFEGFHMPVVKSPFGKTLLTVHDIRGMHSEKGFLDRIIFKQVLGRSLKAADHVITVSQAMKDEILNFYPAIPISVIYNGLDAQEFDSVSEADMQAFRQKYDLPREFILAVGHFEGRKNYLRLIDAVNLLRHRGLSCSLLIVGNDSGSRKDIEKRVVSAKLSDCVKILSGLSDLEVRCAYKLCSLFVFPSSYEGFGIPILEAMAARRPMVLSDIAVFREITQNKGVYFFHNDIESMASAIEKVISSISERARLIEYGIERVRDFNFKGLALQISDLYKSFV